jgi:hypothetical protein
MNLGNSTNHATYLALCIQMLHRPAFGWDKEINIHRFNMTIKAIYKLFQHFLVLCWTLSNIKEVTMFYQV